MNFVNLSSFIEREKKKKAPTVKPSHYSSVNIKHSDCEHKTDQGNIQFKNKQHLKKEK